MLVVGTGAVETADGKSCIPAENVVMAGDYITAANGTPLNTKEELVSCINQSEGHAVTAGYPAGRKVSAASGKPRYRPRRLSIRQESGCGTIPQGIGTLTYVDQEGNFGALGHGISDVDTGSLMEISDGLLYNAEVISIVKGTQGQPGELAGVIHYSDGYRIGPDHGKYEERAFTVPSQDFLFWQSILICMRSGTARRYRQGRPSSSVW